jgi:hypothetical protein
MLGNKITSNILVGFVLALMLFPHLMQAQPTKAAGNGGAWKAVEDAMGRSGKLQPDGSFKFSMPRKDLTVTVNDTPVQAGLALGSWTAFLGAPDHAMVMGDLVLRESEIEPVMLKLQQEGIEQTAIHNHLLHETPRVLYMHIEGHGNATQLAKALHDALALTQTPLDTTQKTDDLQNMGIALAKSLHDTLMLTGAPPDRTPTNADQQNIGIDVAQINSILGHTGKVNGGILQVSVPRSETITDQGIEIPPSMGTSTALNFQPTGNGRAAISGDFVLLANEVNPVIRALRDNGIEVTALHSHMLNEQPRLFFMHFWANDDAVKLARGLRAALDQTKSVR